MTPSPVFPPASGIPASGIPAKGASEWAYEYKPPSGVPAEPVGTTHGATSPRVVGIVAAELRAAVLERRPDLAAYPEALAGWSHAEASALCLREHLDRVGVIDPETDEPRERLLTLQRQHEDSAAKHRAVLGIDPRSEAVVARERAAATFAAVDLEAIAERGRAILQAREGPSVVERALETVRVENAERWPGSPDARR